MKDLTNSYRDPSKKYNQQQQIVVEGEKRSLTPEPNKIPRRSHVSLSSNMRTSVSVSKVKHGPFRRACPAMPRQLAFICFILNIILPGTGTLISSFSVFCCGKHEYEKNILAFFYNILAAILQIATIFLIVGWIWSIRWGLIFIQLAESKNPHTQTTPFYVRRQSSVDTPMHQPFLTGMIIPRVPPVLEDSNELEAV